MGSMEFGMPALDFPEARLWIASGLPTTARTLVSLLPQ
jgi:hypothetical protein